jgi:membrane-associated phospholipid phosphatase
MRSDILTTAILLGLVSGASAQVEPGAGQWQTWVIPAGAQLRLAPPPDANATAAELSTLRNVMSAADDAARNQVEYWNSGSPGYRWMEMTLAELARRNIGGPSGTRAAALVAAAIYDATIAAWDSKYAYNRARPAEVDPTLQPLVSYPASPSFPSEHAAAAGAAAAVLSYLFPDKADAFAGAAREAANSRLVAGAAFPSDTDAGLSLGQTVGQMVVTYAQADGSSQQFTGSFPSAPGVWSSANPVAPLAGTWKPWALSSGAQFRLPAPPAMGTPDANAQLAAVEGLNRTTAVQQTAWFWQPGFQAPWYAILNQRLFETGLYLDAPRAARAYALAAAAQHDAIVACWDTKYAYLAPRPPQVDPNFTSLFPIPQHPSFPSGHACASGGFAQVMDYLFPAESSFFDAKALEAGESTFDAGIHFQIDVDQGLALGALAGQAVVSRAQADGAN